MNIGKLTVNELENLTINIVITRRLKLRLWIATKLFKWIMPCEVNFDDGKKSINETRKIGGYQPIKRDGIAKPPPKTK